MKKYIFILILFFSFYGCSGFFDGNSNDENNIKSVSVIKSDILHDTIKKGSMTFKVSENIKSKKYIWTIKDLNGSIIQPDNNNREVITVNLTKEGIYFISVALDNNKVLRGRITIPNNILYNVTIGTKHTLIKWDNSTSFYVYGSNTHNQLCIYDNTTKHISSPVMLNLSGYNKIGSTAAGQRHTLFTNNKEIYGCGDNTYGQLGLSHSEKVENISLISTLPSSMEYNRIFLSAGGDMSVAGVENIHGGKFNMQVYIWGFNSDKSPTPIMPSDTLSRDMPLISTGHNFSILRATNSDKVYSIGDNSKWQLGRTHSGGSPDKSTNLDDLKPHMYQGVVYVPYGEENINNTSSSTYYQNNYFAKLSAGDDFVVSIKRETKDDIPYLKNQLYAVYVWGSNEKGQLGIKNKNIKETAVKRPTALFNGITNIPAKTDPNQVKPVYKQIIDTAAGRATGYAVSNEGILYAWGENNKGQFTSSHRVNNTNELIYEISRPSGTRSGYKNVWAAGDRVIALAGDGNLYTWGDNVEEILGINSSNAFIDTPQKLYFPVAP